MRWQQEGVIFEPGGRDHSAENGSYRVSKEIAKKIFGYQSPSYVAYDFIGIKGANGKMASSSGNVLTLTDLLNVYDKNIILWFYAKNAPNHQFNIALDEDVLRFYTEYDRMVKAYFSSKLDSKNANIISLTGVTEDYLKNPDFGTIANFLPMINYNIDALINLLSKENIDCNTHQFHSRVIRATEWLNKYNNSKLNILPKFNQEYYDTLSEVEKEWIANTKELLQGNFDSTQELQVELYAIVKSGNPKNLKETQKRYFQIIYNMIVGQDKGPKLGLLLFALDINKINLLFNPQKVATKKRVI